MRGEREPRLLWPSIWPSSPAAAILVAATLLVQPALGASSPKRPSGAGLIRGRTADFKTPETEPLSGGKRGGLLNVVSETDFENLDPGIAYFSVDYTVVYATQRPLYSDKPNSNTRSPDLAARPPQISADGKTVTVKLKRGIHFSPPVNREVTSEDVAYAIERGKNPNVANPYIESYFKAIDGMSTATGGPVRGIETPNRRTIVFRLTEPDGQLVADALQLPLSAPVPKRYAEMFDRHRPSTYANYEVATGPYMLKHNAAGRVLGIGYRPGRSATLVRNPNWRRATDFRPAYLNEIDVHIGGTAASLGRQALTGTNVVQNESSVAQSVEKEAVEKHKSQLEISPGAGIHYIGVNNKVGPFTDANLRKAFWAALDRRAILRAHGGELFGNVATHFIYPGVPGFREAGGLTGPLGPNFDFAEHPEGDMAVVEKYMKLAGYPSGKYTGGKTVTVVAATGSPFEQEAQIVNSTLKGLGFRTEFTAVAVATMYAKYCNVPSEEITVCPNVAWIADFADPQPALDVTFNGKFITPTGNVNWSQADVPKINAAMTAAETITGTAARGASWARIDDELVENAVAIPLHWDKQANVEGRGVHGVGDVWNTGAWDYSWTSLG
jgi:peptide/nickel transport system substrate-binding protein